MATMVTTSRSVKIRLRAIRPARRPALYHAVQLALVGGNRGVMALTMTPSHLALQRSRPLVLLCREWQM